MTTNINYDTLLMEKDVMTVFIKVLVNRPDDAYDFISQYSEHFDKWELKRIILELLYAVHEMTDKNTEHEVLTSTSLELLDLFGDTNE